MEQEIGFCSASDGVSIAYATVSDGTQPVVYVNGWPTQLNMEWEAPQSRGFLEAPGEALGSTLAGAGLIAERPARDTWEADALRLSYSRSHG